MTDVIDKIIDKANIAKFETEGHQNGRKFTDFEQKMDSDVPLTVDQNSVVQSVIESRNSICLTGAAGTGKSFLLGHLIRQLKKIHGVNAIAITASTGIATVPLR
eukprot:Awhi_evm2s2225